MSWAIGAQATRRGRWAHHAHRAGSTASAKQRIFQRRNPRCDVSMSTGRW